jgi:AcrR family transcriptional regulator
MAGTRQRLIDGAIAAIRRNGISGVSARTIAAAAGVNQALVFYHFGSVHELLGVACMTATRERVDAFRDRLDSVASLRDLLDLGRDLHAEERELGNVAVLAQLLAGAQRDAALAGSTAAALGLWIEAVEQVLVRVLRDSPLADVLDTGGLARAVSAGFIGIELLDAVDPRASDDALAQLDRLAALVEVVDGLGPVPRRALRSKLGKTGAR